jgi:hypothetical protein
MNAAIPEPEQTYLQLRRRILDLNPADIGLSPSPAAPHVWGVLIETGYEVGTATLMSLVDGTTSLYYSTGGGMLGSGEFAPLAEASKALVAQAEAQLPLMKPSTKIELPKVGQVKFNLLTYSGILSAQAPEKSLASSQHPLSPLFTQAQITLRRLRALTEKRHQPA